MIEGKAWPDLPADVVTSLLLSDELVCQSEETVVEAILMWLGREPSQAKLSRSDALFELVRWDLLPDSFRADMLHAFEHRSPCAHPVASHAAQSSLGAKMICRRASLESLGYGRSLTPPAAVRVATEPTLCVGGDTADPGAPPAMRAGLGAGPAAGRTPRGGGASGDGLGSGDGAAGGACTPREGGTPAGAHSWAPEWPSSLSMPSLSTSFSLSMPSLPAPSISALSPPPLSISAQSLPPSLHWPSPFTPAVWHLSELLQATEAIPDAPGHAHGSAGAADDPMPSTTNPPIWGSAASRLPPFSSETTTSRVFAMLGAVAEASGEGSWTLHAKLLQLLRHHHSVWLDRPVSAISEPSPPRRRSTWGTLRMTGGTAPNQAPARPARLECTKDHVVGRSRKADFRIGQNAPMPYISGAHFRLFHRVWWPPLDVSGRPDDGAQDGARLESPRDPPAALGSQSPRPRARLEAWIEDLSQNGTFINGLLLGKGRKCRLRDRDRIELVFPQMPAQPQLFTFPSFTFLAPGPPVREEATQTPPMELG